MYFPGLVVRIEDDSNHTIIKPHSSIESFIELAYYSNMLTPHFALESILLTSFYSILPSSPTEEVTKVHKYIFLIANKFFVLVFWFVFRYL